MIAIFPNTRCINFNNLPDKFVLKATHDSGSVLIVKNKADIDFRKLDEIEFKLKINYGYLTKEWVYNDIKPRIIVQEYLEESEGVPLKDYKVFCFNGEPKIIHVDLDRFYDHKRNFYDINWNRLDLEVLYPNAKYEVDKPELLEEMLDKSKFLAKPFNHVRIDWYICKRKLIFGEMTFFHGSGFEKFNKYEWELKLGSWFDISKDLSY
jgi:hypothetical protein